MVISTRLNGYTNVARKQTERDDGGRRRRASPCSVATLCRHGYNNDTEACESGEVMPCDDCALSYHGAIRVACRGFQRFYGTSSIYAYKGAEWVIQ